MRLRLTILAVAVFAAFPAAARAAAPSNDDRADARSIDPLPAVVTGTTKDATIEKGSEPSSTCIGGTGASVWYQATASSAGRVVVELQANGDLDVIVDVFRRVRSQTRPVDCDASDEKGQAATDFQATKGATYLIRVSQLPSSVAGSFTLRVSAPSAPARPPGPGLPDAGATRTLDRAANTDDAWAVSFHAGKTYRLRLAGRNGRCSTRATLYAPGASSFGDATPVRSLGCNGYSLFTPETGAGGRYSIRVQANRRVRGDQTYHLQVAPAGRGRHRAGDLHPQPRARARIAEGRSHRRRRPLPLRRDAPQRDLPQPVGQRRFLPPVARRPRPSARLRQGLDPSRDAPGAATSWPFERPATGWASTRCGAERG